MPDEWVAFDQKTMPYGIKVDLWFAKGTRRVIDVVLLPNTRFPSGSPTHWRYSPEPPDA